MSIVIKILYPTKITQNGHGRDSGKGSKGNGKGNGPNRGAIRASAKDGRKPRGY